MKDLKPEVLNAVEHVCDECDLNRVCLNTPCYRQVRRGTAYTMPPGRSEIRRDVREAVKIAFIELSGGRVINTFQSVHVDRISEDELTVGSIVRYAQPISKPVIVE